MNAKLADKVFLLSSALVGGFICILADLIQKQEASAVQLIGQTLGEIVDLPKPKLFAIGIILIVATLLPLIFESTSKKGAFYAGSSVLAIIMTITPFNPPPNLPTEPNSVEVTLSISTKDGKPVDGAIVTVSPLDAGGKTARSRMQGSQLKFYLNEGKYRLIVELPGYASETRTISLCAGSLPQRLSITLQPSQTPLFIQRILR